MGRFGCVLAVLVAMIVVSPAAAQAAQRFASPTGSPTADPCTTAATPCDVATAINGASPGDEVILAGDEGSYGTPGSPLTGTTLGTGAGDLNVHGAAGQPRPVIYFSNPGSTDFEDIGGDTVSDLAIYDSATFVNPLEVGVSSAADHVLVVASGANSIACEFFQGGTLIDSLCSGAGAVSTGTNCASACTSTETLRNDTLIGGVDGLSVGSGTNDTEDVNVTNTIVRGGTTDITTGTGLGVAANVTLDHSNYASVDTSGGGTVTPAGSATNQTAAPQFVNAAAGDFHEAAGSPTIDAGVNSPANGSTDLDRNPRTLGASTDIGAYELTPAPTCLSATASTPYGQPVAIQLSCADALGAAVSYQLASGPTHGSVSVNASTGVATYTPAAGFSGSDSFRFDASSSHGTGQPATATITVAPASRSVLSGLAVSPKHFSLRGREVNGKCVKPTSKNRGDKACLRSVKLTITYKLNIPATVTFKLTITTTGRSVGGHCVKQTSKNHKRHKRCKRLVSVHAPRAQAGTAGTNTRTFTANLAPGSYVLTATPQGGAPRHVTFKLTT